MVVLEGGGLFLMSETSGVDDAARGVHERVGILVKGSTSFWMCKVRYWR